MIQYEMTQILNVKLSSSQLNKLQPAMKNEAEVILRLSSIWKTILMMKNKLLLTSRQVVNPCKSFASSLSVNIKLSKTQLSKIIRGISW